MISLLPHTLQALFSYIMWQSHSSPAATHSIKFQLRHEHAISDTGRNIFSNVPSSFAPTVHMLSASPQMVHKPSTFAAHSHARWNSYSPLWHEDEILAPNVTDRNTLLTLAKMTSNDYTTPDQKDWYHLDGWNQSYPFGWEPDQGVCHRRAVR